MLRCIPRGERFNTLTHLAGALLALAGALALVDRALDSGRAAALWSFSIFGAALVLLYTASALYHASRGVWKDRLRTLDHCAIYLLIAGTYAPFMLVSLAGPWGWTLMVLVAALCCAGLWLELAPRGASTPRRHKWALLLYLGMGWLGVVALGPLAQALGTQGMFWLAAGGVAYTVGVLFYLLDHRWNVPHTHGVWHLFVLAGSGSHFGAVFGFVR
jgi:hemolysin III